MTSPVMTSTLSLPVCDELLVAAEALLKAHEVEDPLRQHLARLRLKVACSAVRNVSEAPPPPRETRTCLDVNRRFGLALVLLEREGQPPTFHVEHLNPTHVPDWGHPMAQAHKLVEAHHRAVKPFMPATDWEGLSRAEQYLSLVARRLS
jgi:hypothetical protein